MTDPTKHRPDIDGLRGIAVLSVIAFHVDPSWLPGGFVGVDIFFVISGYLISLNIFGEIEGGRFSLADFYRRRIKRIAPAMLVVVGAVSLVSHLLFRPEEAERAAESALWSIFSLSNVYFWLHHDASYFAAAAIEKPLLHLWSLGVEEQFYLLWPLVLALAYRRSRARWFMLAMGLAIVASLLAAQVLFPVAPSFVYYMLPTRAGELLIGAVAALIVSASPSRPVPPAAVTGAATAGLILVGASLVLLDGNVPFPGWLALPPTVGAALLILAGHAGPGWATRVLSSRPLVGMGLISYSAYLWHWPLLSFLHYGYPMRSGAMSAAVVLLTIALAWLSYRYVETPARRSTASARTVALWQYAIPGGALAVLAVVAMKLDGYALRSAPYRQELASLRSEVRPANAYDYVCQEQRLALHDVVDPKCVVGADAQPRAILWGDSNAAHYVGMVGAFAQQAGFSFRNVAVGACPPLDQHPGAYVDGYRLADCLHSRTVAGPVVEAFPVVIVAAAWNFYRGRSERFLEDLSATVRRLADGGRLVILLGNVPTVRGYDPRCREKALSYPWLTCSLGAVPLAPDVRDVNARLQAFADRMPNVEYFDANAFLCPDGLCALMDGDAPRYSDPRHLTMGASWNIGRAIVQREGVPEPFTRITGWSGRPATAAKVLD